MQFSRKVLKNGLRVITVPTSGVESATTLVMVGSGSRFENKHNNGISHFLEHMAFKGTKRRPTALEIATLFDGIGAETNAFTGKEYTGYYVKSASQHVGLSLEVLSDMLKNLLLDKQEIERERGVILEEINMYEDTPMRKIGDMFETLLYRDTPMGWDIAGPKEIILKIQREDFTKYLETFYSPHNMAVLVVGNIDEKKVISDIEKHFSDLKRFDTPQAEKTDDSQNGIEVMLKTKKTEQAHYALGVRTSGFNNVEDRYPLSILSAILGGGMSSRLFHEVRERRGLAYYVRANSEHYEDVGYLAAYAGVDPKRIDESIEVTMDVLKKIAKKDIITKGELKKAKEFIKGHFVLELEDSRNVAVYYAMHEILENKLVNPEETMRKIDQVGMDDVERVAKKYLNTSNYSLSLIGDFENKSRFEKLIS